MVFQFLKYIKPTWYFNLKPAQDFSYFPTEEFLKYKGFTSRNGFEASTTVETNFIYRKNYRGEAYSEEERTKTTLEYYDNIKNSDYVLCVRGAGNFSVRLYETLMMGYNPHICQYRLFASF